MYLWTFYIEAQINLQDGRDTIMTITFILKKASKMLVALNDQNIMHFQAKYDWK